MRALSIRQPWAWLIVHGHKDIENRTWSTSYRGPLLIHASATVSRAEFDAAVLSVLQEFGITVPRLHDLPRGGIVGVADLVDCVPTSDSPWHLDDHTGLVLRNARPLPFQPCKGSLSLFHVPAASVGLAPAVTP